MERIEHSLERIADAIEAHTAMIDSTFNRHSPKHSSGPFSEWAYNSMSGIGDYWDGDKAMEYVADAITNATANTAPYLSVIDKTLESIQTSISDAADVVAEAASKKRRVE